MYFEQDGRFALLFLSGCYLLGFIVNILLFGVSPMALWGASDRGIRASQYGGPGDITSDVTEVWRCALKSMQLEYNICTKCYCCTVFSRARGQYGAPC